MPMFVEKYIASIDKSHTCRHYYFIGIRYVMRISSLQSTGLLHLDGFGSHLYSLTNNKSHLNRWLLLLVEPRGIEPLSESNLEGTSPGAVCYLHSLIPAGTNTLRESVAS